MANLGYVGGGGHGGHGGHGGGHGGGGHGGGGRGHGGGGRGHGGGGRGWGGDYGGIVPIVVNDRMVEEVDLQPYGNTVVIETVSDNPFEDDLPVEVFTQMSGGMAGPDPKQTSRARVLAKKGAPVKQTMAKGRAPAVQFRAPANRIHTGFIPGIAGLGAEAAATTPPADKPFNWATDLPGILTPVVGAATTVTGQLSTAKQAQAAADLAAAQASGKQADAAIAQQQGIMATAMANMNKNKWLTYGLLAAGGLALLTAIGLKVAKSRR
jgi:hypothetical protein